LKQIYNKIAFLIHPILLSVYPVLFLYSYNISQTAFKEILLPTAISSGFSLILLFIIILLSKNKFKSSLFISLLLLLFFSYGHLSEILFHKLRTKNPDYVLIPVFSLALILFVWLIIKTSANLNFITHIINLTAFSLILLSCFSIIKFSLETGKPVIPEADLEKRISAANIKTDNLPDIYYIILDGYAGEETLKNIYNFDNSEFLNFLRSKGFFIASKSRSNYIHTALSLASSLNMNYLHDFFNKSYSKDNSMRIMFDLINNNITQRILKKIGYTTININSGSALTTHNPFSDINIEPDKLNEFNIILLQTTVIFPLIELFGYSNHFRRHIKNTFNIITEISKLKNTTYTFSHILVPHPPFLFSENNLINFTKKLEIENSWCNKEDYLNQLKAVNLLTKKMVSKILECSDRKPIIIIQADHGPASLFCEEENSWEKLKDRALKERFSILNALLLPSNNYMLSLCHSPVNTFRIIFNDLTDNNFKLLNNEYYFSIKNDIFNLKKVPFNE